MLREPAPPPRRGPDPSLVRALRDGAGWVTFLGVAGLVAGGLGLIALLASVRALDVLPEIAARFARWLTLGAILASLGPMASAALLLRYGLVVRRLDHRATTGDVETALERLGQYWHVSALLVLGSVVFGVLLVIVLGAAAAAVPR